MTRVSGYLDGFEAACAWYGEPLWETIREAEGDGVFEGMIAQLTEANGL